MNAIHGAQDPYRLPPPPGPYRADAYGPQAGQGPYQAAAPRQRTAIACRYCRRRKVRRSLPIYELPRANFYTIDSLLGIRDLGRWTMQQLRSIQPRLHVHSGLFTNSSLCARAHRLPSSTTWTEWTRARGPWWTACPVRRSRTAAASSTAATRPRDHLAAASRDVLSERTTSHGRCPASPCVNYARSGKAAIPPLVRGRQGERSELMF